MLLSTLCYLCEDNYTKNGTGNHRLAKILPRQCRTVEKSSDYFGGFDSSVFLTQLTNRSFRDLKFEMAFPER